MNTAEKTETIEIIDFKVIEYAQSNLMHLIGNSVSNKVLFLKDLRERYNLNIRQNTAVYDYCKIMLEV